MTFRKSEKTFAKTKSSIKISIQSTKWKKVKSTTKAFTQKITNIVKLSMNHKMLKKVKIMIFCENK